LGFPEIEHWEEVGWCHWHGDQSSNLAERY